MNLQEELKALKERIAELEELAKEEQEFPQDGDECWYILSGGGVDWIQWGESGFGLRAQDIGNIFRTKQQAEFAVEKLKVEAELRKFSRPFKNGQSNCNIILSDNENVSTAYWKEIQIQGSIYFESAEKAQQAIEAVGIDRIKKYIFEVEDYYETSSY